MESTVLHPSSPSSPTSPNKTKWIIIAAAIYLALPFDMIPLLGIVGDLGAFLVALNATRTGLPRRSE